MLLRVLKHLKIIWIKDESISSRHFLYLKIKFIKISFCPSYFLLYTLAVNILALSLSLFLFFLLSFILSFADPAIIKGQDQ